MCLRPLKRWASAGRRCTASSSSCAADVGGLFARLVDSSDPVLMRQALAWLYGFVRPHRRAIGLLLGIYCGGMYGGSISAILIHAPGTPAAAATLLDGYPMCKKGQAGKALSVAMFASFCGGVIGAGTRKALRAWQQSQQLPADGYLSNDMVARLKAQAGINP